jgi:SAM-dependent methyltransferase
MQRPLSQHQREIELNQKFWRKKALLQKIYGEFYYRILRLIRHETAGQIVEIGSGIGNLKSHLPAAISTDLFPNQWLDLVCDGYELPFVSGSLSHLILVDVFHHLERPTAFLKEARRVLVSGGRLVLLEPYISWTSYPVYGLLHHEPVAWSRPISVEAESPSPRPYYAAQGNATRLFFRKQAGNWLAGWSTIHKEVLASFSYLLSGGFSKPALYPAGWCEKIQRLDAALGRWPDLFGTRCLVGLERI